MSEHEEQVLLFQWAKMNEDHVPELWYLYAVPNGAKLPYRGKGKRRYSPEAQRLKAEGLKPGVPDVALPVPRGSYHGMYIEMKFDKNKTTKHQDEWLFGLQSMGYYVCVPYGFVEAKNEIIKYLGLREGTYIDMI